MGWITFATIHNIQWNVEENPHRFFKAFKFKKEGNELIYVIPYEVLKRTHRSVLERELLRVLREVFNEYN